MKIKILMLLIIVLVAKGCSFSGSDWPNNKTWGERSQINRQDVKQVMIENSGGAIANITAQIKLTAFIDALKKGVFDPAIFDIRAPDFIVTIELKNGEEKNIELWLDSGANLFTDLDDNGHFTLPKDARKRLVETIKEGSFN